MPRVREDFGYPPLVTPTSQIVGTQAVLNVLFGQRYKTFTEGEPSGLLRGEYGQSARAGERGSPQEGDRRREGHHLPSGRPAQAGNWTSYREEIRDQATCEEDVLSYALFPQVAEKFFKYRQAKQNGIDSTVLDGSTHPV